MQLGEGFEGHVVGSVRLSLLGLNICFPADNTFLSERLRTIQELFHQSQSEPLSFNPVVLAVAANASQITVLQLQEDWLQLHEPLPLPRAVKHPIVAILQHL